MNTNAMTMMLMAGVVAGGAAGQCPWQHGDRAGVPAVGTVAPVSYQPERPEPRRGFVAVRPLEGQPDVKTDVHIIMKGEKRVNGKTVTFESENGRMRATIDGEEVPPDRIKREGSAVVILDKDGSEAARFHLAITGRGGGIRVESGDDMMRLMGPGEEFDFEEFFGQDQPFGLLAPEETPPPVMIGITMSEVPEDLRADLGLKEGEGFRIERVMEGLPGARAGLRAGDVVVGLDGKGPVTMQALRDALMDRKPGDRVTLTVLRDGKKVDVEVRLAKWDPAALGQGGVPGAQQREREEEIVGQWRRWEDELRESLEEAMKSIRSYDVPEEARRSIERALKQSMEQIEEARRRWGQGRFLFGDRPEQVFIVPPRAPAVPDRADAEIRELRRQVEDLTRQREALADELAEIKAMLKELLRKGG